MAWVAAQVHTLAECLASSSSYPPADDLNEDLQQPSSSGEPTVPGLCYAFWWKLQLQKNRAPHDNPIPAFFSGGLNIPIPVFPPSKKSDLLFPMNMQPL